ncbi:succinate-semialdehyde dehydrogenase/glutarate-semialdehyde dehydrogenase [Novosphingobium hassiacum]|uniref:Succinate-semialdehyde dehydrogenase/glutarate-semialdehyde dehydrogenase n=1 Tax=Novosphingobium hassiacum TaxID=173676 RepID=A0A7W5ZYF6_9SPHN|nr:succinate-semialdehyde dehydrogenase/glutarate-semialdehyde dehydrogenase [Novosphingobium hassiacum]
MLGELPHATRHDLDRSLEASGEGFALWRRTSPRERARILKRAADFVRERQDYISWLCTVEEGKPLAEARIEIAMAADTIEWYAEEGRRAYGRIIPTPLPEGQLRVTLEPVGPVAAFCPWNFPATNPARKIGAALAAGCSCIVKPPEEAPGTALAIAEAFVDAGLPAGVLSVVFGEPADISAHLLSSPVIRKLSFTGSVPVGKHLVRLCSERMIRTTMELGGHAPVIVCDDADINQTLDLSVASKFRNAGQVCVSPTRFYVQEAIYDRFVEGFAERAKNLPVGDGLDPRTRMGPLAHPRRIEAMEGLIADAVQSGARVVAGGARIGNQGWFWAPTVLADVPDSARIMSEEPFGPVAVLNRVSTMEEALEKANGLPFGLAAYGFSNDVRRAAALSDGLQAGMVGINNFAISLVEAPFGGIKESGHGSENGVEGLAACLVTKFVNQS